MIEMRYYGNRLQYRFLGERYTWIEDGMGGTRRDWSEWMDVPRVNERPFEEVTYSSTHGEGHTTGLEGHEERVTVRTLPPQSAAEWNSQADAVSSALGAAEGSPSQEKT